MNTIIIFILLLCVGFVYNRYLEHTEKNTHVNNYKLINKYLLKKK